MPKLWNDTIESHRQDVREAILDATAELATELGLSAVTMSQIAVNAGIGRATLYKYFPDVHAILVAWHERQVTGHLALLVAARDQTGTPEHRLESVLETYARIAYEEHSSELVALMRRGEHVTRAYAKLAELIRDLITDGAKSGTLRSDVAPAELTTFCVHALSGANDLPSMAAVRRLVSVTMTGLRRAKR